MNNCLVAIKKVINPYSRIKVKTDLSGIDYTNMRFVANPFDVAALEHAVVLKAQGNINVVTIVSIGEDCQEILRQALAKGADRAIWVKTKLNLSPLNIAKILQHIANQNQCNLVFLGKQAIDDDCDQTGQMLAGILNWPQSCGTTNIAFDDKFLCVEKDLDNRIEVINITLPAVITFELSANEPQKISLAQLMQAKKKPLDLIELEQLPIYNKLNTKQVVITKVCQPPAKPSGIKLTSSRELVDLLIDKEKLVL